MNLITLLQLLVDSGAVSPKAPTTRKFEEGFNFLKIAIGHQVKDKENVET